MVKPTLRSEGVMGASMVWSFLVRLGCSPCPVVSYCTTVARGGQFAPAPRGAIRKAGPPPARAGSSRAPSRPWRARAAGARRSTPRPRTGAPTGACVPAADPTAIRGGRTARARKSASAPIPPPGARGSTTRRSRTRGWSRCTAGPLRGRSLSLARGAGPGDLDAACAFGGGADDASGYGPQAAGQQASGGGTGGGPACAGLVGAASHALSRPSGRGHAGGCLLDFLGGGVGLDHLGQTHLFGLLFLGAEHVFGQGQGAVGGDQAGEFFPG